MEEEKLGVDSVLAVVTTRLVHSLMFRRVIQICEKSVSIGGS